MQFNNTLCLLLQFTILILISFIKIHCITLLLNLLNYFRSILQFIILNSLFISLNINYFIELLLLPTDIISNSNNIISYFHIIVFMI